MVGAVTIPLSSANLIVQPHELSDGIITILRHERVEHGVWMECARALLAQGRVDVYEKLLKTLIEEVERLDSAKFIHVQALCSQADLYLQQAQLADDADRKRALVAAASTLYFKAEKVDRFEMLPHLGLGELALIGDTFDVARKSFEAACRLRCNGKRNVAGTLALARLAFLQGSYVDALRFYRDALRSCPQGPAELRLGIAVCQFRLGEINKAEAAFKRVLELDPGATQALLGLAVIALVGGAGADAGAIQTGSRLLAQAFRQDPHNPHTLVLLAHFSLQQGLAVQAMRLAKAALDRAGADEKALRAEATCLLGRAHHSEGDLGSAVRCYQECLTLDPKQPTARLALAQMTVMKGELKGAADALERVLEERPAWMDALRVLGPICPRQAGAAAAARHFKEAALKDPQTPALWEMLGDVLAATDPPAALSAYTTAIELHRKAAVAEPVAGENGGAKPPAGAPARLLNNAAVLQLRAGNAAAASQLVAEAIASAVAGGLSELGPEAQVTLGYNAARVREATGDLKAAEAEYKALLGQFPQYSDCHLRLACIAKARGDVREAEDSAQRAAEVSGRSADALALLAGLHLERRDIAAAKRCLEELHSTLGSMGQETYARVALANVHLYSITGDLSKLEVRAKAESQLSHALGLYRRVLERDPSNIFAANGIGCVLAESGRLEEAKEVFLRVQEAAAGTDGFFRLPNVWVNLANVYMGLQQYGAAEQTYINAMRRFPEARDDPRVQLYLAMAQYDGNRRGAALRTLCRTLHLAPRDPRIRFNIAYTLQQHATDVIGRTDWPAADSMVKVTALTTAIAHLNSAHRIFKGLQSAGAEASGMAQRSLEEHITFVEAKFNAANALAAQAQADAKAAAERREMHRKKLESEAAAKQAEERLKAAQEAAAAKARDAVAQEKTEQLVRLKAEWKQGDKLAKAAAAGDASAVGKGRQSGDGPKQQQQQQVDAVDAFFGDMDEEDDDDYVPGQDDSAGGPPPGAEGGAAAEGDSAFAAAGLVTSDDEIEFDFAKAADEEEAEEKASTAKKAAPASGGRLKKKKKKRARESGGGGNTKEGEQVKRARAATVLEDSEEEGEAAGQGPSAADKAVLGDSE